MYLLFEHAFSEQQKLTKNMLSHLWEASTVWKQPVSVLSFSAVIPSCHNLLDVRTLPLLLQSSLVNNCCHPEVKIWKLVSFVPSLTNVCFLFAGISHVALPSMCSIYLFLESYVKQMNMSNDEYIILGMLGGSIMTEEREWKKRNSILCWGDIPFCPIRIRKYE